MANNRLKIEDYFERQAIALEAIAEANKEYTITVDMKDTEGNEVTNENVVVSNVATGVVLKSVVYNGTPVAIKLQKDTQVKITGSTLNPSLSGVFLPNAKELFVQQDTSVQVTYKKFNKLKSLAAFKLAVEDNPETEILPVGSVLTIPYTKENGVVYDWEFVIRRWGYATLRSGEKKWGAFLYANSCLEGVQFDAVETEVATEETAAENIYYYGVNGSTYTLLTLEVGDTIPYSDYTTIYKNSVRDTNFYCQKYGYNRWSMSGIRQYLNSDAGVGAWWTAQHIGDKAPSQLNSRFGMLYGFEQEDRAALTNIKIVTALNTHSGASLGATETTYDKMWLPSKDEVYGTTNITGGEDEPNTEYWNEYLGVGVCSDNEATLNGLRKLPLINNKTSYQYYWLRSCNRGNANVWDVGLSGGLNGGTPGYAYCVAPACFIG